MGRLLVGKTYIITSDTNRQYRDVKTYIWTLKICAVCRSFLPTVRYSSSSFAGLGHENVHYDTVKQELSLTFESHENAALEKRLLVLTFLNVTDHFRFYRPSMASTLGFFVFRFIPNPAKSNFLLMALGFLTLLRFWPFVKLRNVLIYASSFCCITFLNFLDFMIFLITAIGGDCKEWNIYTSPSSFCTTWLAVKRTLHNGWMRTANEEHEY